MMKYRIQNTNIKFLYLILIFICCSKFFNTNFVQEVGIKSISGCSVSIRRLKGNNTAFIHPGEELEFDGNKKVFKNQEEIDFLNAEIAKFVRHITGASVIINVSQPKPFPGANGERVRVYRFDVETDKGEVSIYLKWLEDDIEGERFEKASQLGIAPESHHIPLGYVVSEHFEGVELAELISQKDWITSKDNYTWLFTELGHLVAKLENNGIEYNDLVKFNIIVNLNSHKVKIIDFENAQMKTNNGDLIFVNDIATAPMQIGRVVDSLSKIGIDRALREEMIRIFKDAYNEEKNKP